MKLLHIILFCCLFPNWIGLSQAENRWVYSPIYRDKLLKAVVTHESNYNDSARGEYNDVGILQITPIMVRHCNKLAGYPLFDNIDRYNREKSITMWYMVQRKYNKTYDPAYACMLWHSFNKKWDKRNQRYLKKVMKIYCEL